MPMKYSTRVSLLLYPTTLCSLVLWSTAPYNPVHKCYYLILIELCTMPDYTSFMNE